MAKILGQRAVVAGGSIAGLLTARVLSEYFDQVVVLDQDNIENRPVARQETVGSLPLPDLRGG